uniref:Exocyst complex component Sec8 n=1 Tax=Megaselia scalaris TaxID=36166 RepID=T1GLE4_MEGSC
ASSGFLVTVIKTLEFSETAEERQNEKLKIEKEFKKADNRLNELVSKHDKELTKVLPLFSKIQLVLKDYLDIENSQQDEIDQGTFNDSAPSLAFYFSRRKIQPKKNLFKFDKCSTSPTDSPKGHRRNPSNASIDDALDGSAGGSGRFKPKKKQEKALMTIESLSKNQDAWRSITNPEEMKSLNLVRPLLQSTVLVERRITETKTLIQDLPNYSEDLLKMVCALLKTYRETCQAAYRGIVQPDSEDKRIYSVAWLKDEDISRFLKTLPNWTDLKFSRSKTTNRSKLQRSHYEPSEEESPTQVQQRNIREAEMLTSNLGEGGISHQEILSDITILKELAILQESMEWFSSRISEFANELRRPILNGINTSGNTEYSPITIQDGTIKVLTNLALEFDELANTCLLVLHLEVRVQCFHYLRTKTVPRGNSFMDKNDSSEPDAQVLKLTKVLQEMDDAFSSLCIQGKQENDLRKVPLKVTSYSSKRQYLHATKVLTDAISTAEKQLLSVEGLSDLRSDMQVRKDQLYTKLHEELSKQLYRNSTKEILNNLQRQNSNRLNGSSSNFQRNFARRSTDRAEANAKVRKALVDMSQGFDLKTSEIVEDADLIDPDLSMTYFISIIVECFAMMKKVPESIEEIKCKIQSELLEIVQVTTAQMISLNIASLDKDKHPVLCLLEIIFKQFKAVAQTHALLLKNYLMVLQKYSITTTMYDLGDFWQQAQQV